MKFSIHQAVLLNLIQTVSKAVATRTTKQVLSGILIDVQSSKLTMTAYDLELGIQDTINVTEDNGLIVSEEGSIVLPARFFLDVVRKLPSQDVFIEVNNNYMTEIKSGGAEFHLHGIDYAEFPRLPIFNRSQVLEIPSGQLKILIQSTSFAASNSEVRPILTGVHVQLSDQCLLFTATDGLRLAKQQFILTTATDTNWNAVLPSKSLTELGKVLPDDNEIIIKVEFTETHSMFLIGHTKYYTRLIDGAYPDTSRLIPCDSKTNVTIAVQVIAGAIDRAALIARDRDNHQVRLEVQQGQITLSSSSPEIGNVSEVVQSSLQQGEDLSIAFNAKYVLDALKTILEDESVISFNGTTQPFVIRSIANSNGLQLISPVLTR